jgi:hypothetical protein
MTGNASYGIWLIEQDHRPANGLGALWVPAEAELQDGQFRRSEAASLL